MVITNVLYSKSRKTTSMTFKSYTESGATIINDVHARSNHITTAISPPQLQPPGRVWESLQQMGWQETLQW